MSKGIESPMRTEASYAATQEARARAETAIEEILRALDSPEDQLCRVDVNLDDGVKGLVVEIFFKDETP